ncbi:MAG TPA: hypothetical protein PLQ44_02345 [Candidatus Paceibacterota bacterium]|nr:hypothetical protein [Candidatus Paceibacterota bacterium]HPT40419.1 hypothetical protein [Candidatus Paceibacterota bacterium]
MFKKSLITFLISTIIVSTFSPLFFTVPKAEAQGFGLPLVIGSSFPLQLVQQQLAQQAAQTFISKVVDQALKAILEMLRKKLLDYFVDSIVKWVQGTDGKPAFVTNWRKFMGDVVNDALGSYVKTTKFAGLCDTFDFQVRVSLPQVNSRPALPTCTLNQIVGNIENFYNDFREGGWLAFDESLNPRGNPYGAYMTAIEGAAYEMLTAQAEQEQEQSQSQGGFLNTKKCTASIDDPLTGEKSCLLWETTTPGTTIAQRLQKALDVDIDNVLSATEFTTYIATIADAAINRLFRAGKDGLLGMLTKEAPANYEDLGTTGPSDINYECDKDLGACVMTVGGKYTSKEECDTACAGGSGVKYACEENSYTCTISPFGEFNTKDSCTASCKADTSDNSDWPYPTCDACRAGVYVRGRGNPGNSTKGNCSANGTCTMCSAASQSTPSNLCQTFCEATREEAWGGKTGQNTRTFTRDEITSSGYDLIWSKGGSSVPSDGCTCSYSGNYKKVNEYSFGNGYTHDDSYCYDCTSLPASAKNLSVWGTDAAEPQSVCTGSTWCDTWCCPTCPTPPVHP